MGKIMNNLACLAETRALDKYKHRHERIVRRFRRAERLHERCRDRRVAVLGEDHIDSLSSLANLASFHKVMSDIYQNYTVDPDKDNNDEALKEYFKFYKTKLAYHEKEAEKYLVECLRKRQSVLGQDHPETLKTLFNNAEWLLDKARLNGEYRKAEGKYQQCLDKRRTKLG